MAIQIKNVTVTPNITTVGQPFSVTVLAEEVCWENLYADFASWGEVRRSFTNWNKVKNYIYSIPDPTLDTDCLYTSNGDGLFDVDAVQISISGGATSQYDGVTIDQFIGEVING